MRTFDGAEPGILRKRRRDGPGLQEPPSPHGTTPDIPKGKGWCPNTASARDVGGMGAPLLPNRTITNTGSGWLWLSSSFQSLPSLGFSTLRGRCHTRKPAALFLSHTVQPLETPAGSDARVFSTKSSDYFSPSQLPDTGSPKYSRQQCLHFSHPFCQHSCKGTFNLHKFLYSHLCWPTPGWKCKTPNKDNGNP